MGVCSNCHLGQTLLTSRPPPPTQTYFQFPLFLLADRYTFRQTHARRHQRLQSAFFSIAEKQREGEKRRTSIPSFDCFRLRSFTAGLHAQLQTATFSPPPTCAKMWPLSDANKKTKRCCKDTHVQMSNNREASHLLLYQHSCPDRSGYGMSRLNWGVTGPDTNRVGCLLLSTSLSVMLTLLSQAAVLQSNSVSHPIIRRKRFTVFAFTHVDISNSASCHKTLSHH